MHFLDEGFEKAMGMSPAGIERAGGIRDRGKGKPHGTRVWHVQFDRALEDYFPPC